MASLAAKLRVISLTLLFCPSSLLSESAEQMQFLMGTTARVRVYGTDSVTCARAIDSVFAAFHSVDAEMSTYKPHSDLSHFNLDGHRDWVQLGPNLIKVLAKALDYSRASVGAFDPTVLPLMRLWGFRGGTPAIPAPTSLDSVLSFVGHRYVEIDTSRSRGRLAKAGVQVDLGGIAKGFALDLGKAAALAAGAHAGLLDLGGNVISFGAEAAGRVGIQDPDARAGLVGRVWLEDASIATSGGYERFVEIEGRRFGHVIDPRTGVPADHVAAVTVISADAVDADALSTACFVLEPEACRDLLGDRDAKAILLLSESDSLSVEVIGDVTLIP